MEAIDDIRKAILAKYPESYTTCVHAHVLSCLSHVQLFATLWTVACQAPLYTGFSGQEYWSGLPCGTSLKELFPVEFVFLDIEDEKNRV